jgi:exportin-5
VRVGGRWDARATRLRCGFYCFLVPSRLRAEQNGFWVSFVRSFGTTWTDDDDFFLPAVRTQLKTGDVRRAIDASRSLCARVRALEARHFGFAVLRDLARHRWRELRAEERVEMAQLAHGLLNEVAMGGGEPEPYVIKSKTATLMAEVVRQEGAGMWNQLVPDLVNMTLSDEPQRAELGVNVIRFVAEDVAVYNDDLIGGRMRELLGALSSTVGTILPAIYSLMEKHYLKATSTQDGRIAKQHSAAVSAALGAAAVYSEWAPLAPIMRSGLIEACGMLLVRTRVFKTFFSSRRETKRR